MPSHRRPRRSDARAASASPARSRLQALERPSPPDCHRCRSRGGPARSSAGRHLRGHAAVRLGQWHAAAGPQPAICCRSGSSVTHTSSHSRRLSPASSSLIASITTTGACDAATRAAIASPTADGRSPPAGRASPDRQRRGGPTRRGRSARPGQDVAPELRHDGRIRRAVRRHHLVRHPVGVDPLGAQRHQTLGTTLLPLPMPPVRPMTKGFHAISAHSAINWCSSVSIACRSTPRRWILPTLPPRWQLRAAC